MDLKNKNYNQEIDVKDISSSFYCIPVWSRGVDTSMLQIDEKSLEMIKSSKNTEYKLLKLKEKFNEIKTNARKIIEAIKVGEKSKDAGLVYWKQLKLDIKNEDYLDDNIRYNWNLKWQIPPFKLDDTQDEFEWPNGYKSIPRGFAKSIHYERQLYRIPSKKDPLPIYIFQIALNIGQSNIDYEFNDFVNTL